MRMVLHTSKASPYDDPSHKNHRTGVFEDRATLIDWVTTLRALSYGGKWDVGRNGNITSINRGTHRSIGEICGVSASTVSSILKRYEYVPYVIED